MLYSSSVIISSWAIVRQIITDLEHYFHRTWILTLKFDELFQLIPKDLYKFFHKITTTIFIFYNNRSGSKLTSASGSHPGAVDSIPLLAIKYFIITQATTDFNENKKLNSIAVNLSKNRH